MQSLLRRRPLLRRVALVAVLALALGALVVESGQVPHLHGDGTAGLYNEQHVFAALFEGPLRAVAVVRHAGPRAPPAR